MKKNRVIILLLLVLLSVGCQNKKGEKTSESTAPETTSQITIESIKTPTASEIALPKISGINYFGKDVWTDQILTEMKIVSASSSVGDETLYLSLHSTSGLPNSEMISDDGQLISIPWQPGTQVTERSGTGINASYTLCQKIIQDQSGKLYFAGRNYTGEGMKVEAYNTDTNQSEWQMIDSKETESVLTQTTYYEGIATDLILTGDDALAYVSNIPNAAGVNISYLTKVYKDGAEIYHKELPGGIYVEKIIEGSTSDTFYVLAKIEKDNTSSIMKIEKGNVVQTLNLNYHADRLKSADKGNFFVLGTEHEDEQNQISPMALDTETRISKIDETLATLYTYSSAAYDRFSDCLQMANQVYLFVGNTDLNTVVAAFYDSGKALVPIKEDVYPDLGQPTEVIAREKNGKFEYVMTGINLNRQGEYASSYAWLAYLYPLEASLDNYYNAIVMGESEGVFLKRGNTERTEIAWAIAEHEGNGELMYIRYMKSDDVYCYVITGKWDNAQIIEQYLLKKETDGWKVGAKFASSDYVFDTIAKTYPEVKTAILPPFEVASYPIKNANDQLLQQFITVLEPKKTVKDVTYSSYIGDYFYVMFDGGSDYLVKYPESKAREVYQVNDYTPYNYYLIDDALPPYFLLLQN